MFTLTDMPVKFVGLLVLFTFTTLYEFYRTGTTKGAVERTSAAWHLLMSVIMLLMVPRSWWKPFEAVVPLPVSIGLMALGALWFVWRATQAKEDHRLHSVGCALMFAAMTWHLTAMMIKMSAMKAAMKGHGHGHGHGAAMATGAGTPVWWLAVVGLPLMAWLLFASVRATATAVRRPDDRLAAVNDFAMNFGMFWMSTGLLVPILPFFKHLAF